MVWGSGGTERDLRDFIYFVSSDRFKQWVFILPPHIGISEQDASRWATISRVDSAMLGDVLGSRWIILLRGDLSLPELDSRYGWRPPGTIGVRFYGVNVALECAGRQLKRSNPISDSIGEIIFVLDESSQRIMTIDPHIPSRAISKVRNPPLVRPSRLRGDRTLNTGELICALGGLGFWAKGEETEFRNISRLMPHGGVHRPPSGTGFPITTSNYTWIHRVIVLMKGPQTPPRAHQTRLSIDLAVNASCSEPVLLVNEKGSYHLMVAVRD